MSPLAYMQMTNAYRSDRIRNLTPMMGEGIGSFWSDISMEVVKGDGYVRTGATAPLKNLNPVAAKDHLEFMALRMIYDRLFRIDPEGNESRDLLELPSVLHGQAETRRLRRPRRALQHSLQEKAARELAPLRPSHLFLAPRGSGPSADWDGPDDR